MFRSKKGDIDTKTAQGIAFDICTAFGSSFKDLSDNTEKHFTEFIVVASGEINEFARENIFAFMQRDDLKRLVKFKDGSKLVNLICEYRMDLLWDEYDYFKKYFDALTKKFRKIEDAFALGMKEPPELEKLWVPLNLSETVTERLPFPEVERERMPDMRTERQIKRKLKIEDAIRMNRKCVITGRPGSGKSTILKHLCLKSIEQNLDALEREVTPVFVVLRELAESGKSLREFIDTVLETAGFPEASHFIERDLQEGKCLLLLDGFDELATPQNQQAVKREIEEFMTKYSKIQTH